MNEKLCTGCQIIKPVLCFTRRKRSKDGLNSRCRQCEKKAQARQTKLERL